MMKIVLLTLAALVDMTHGARYSIAIGYPWAEGYTSCAGEDEKIFQSVTLPALRDTNLGVADGQWMAGNTDLTLTRGRQLRVRDLAVITDTRPDQAVIASQILKTLSGLTFSCIRNDSVNVYISEAGNIANRYLEAFDVLQDEVTEDDNGEQGQRSLHACNSHPCQADCWCQHGVPSYCQSSC